MRINLKYHTLCKCYNNKNSSKRNANKIRYIWIFLLKKICLHFASFLQHRYILCKHLKNIWLNYVLYTCHQKLISHIWNALLNHDNVVGSLRLLQGKKNTLPQKIINFAWKTILCTWNLFKCKIKTAAPHIYLHLNEFYTIGNRDV